MLYASNETDPRARYKGLSDENLIVVDNFVIRLVNGDAHEPADFYKLKKENEMLLQQLEMIKSSGYENM